MLTRINMEAAQVDLKITTKKTHISIKMGAQQSKCGEVIKSGNNFKYFQKWKNNSKEESEKH